MGIPATSSPAYSSALKVNLGKGSRNRVLRGILFSTPRTALNGAKLGEEAYVFSNAFSVASVTISLNGLAPSGFKSGISFRTSLILPDCATSSISIPHSRLTIACKSVLK